MPSYSDTRTLEVNATPADCFGVLTDYERLPEWQSRVCECRVLERDDAGRGELVEYAIDAKLRMVRYQLRHRYEEPTRIGSEYVEGDFHDLSGDYQFSARDGATEVRFELTIDPGFRIPNSVAKMLGQAVMERSLQDLKRRVEEVTGGSK